MAIRRVIIESGRIRPESALSVCHRSRCQFVACAFPHAIEERPENLGSVFAPPGDGQLDLSRGRRHRAKDHAWPVELLDMLRQQHLLQGEVDIWKAFPENLQRTRKKIVGGRRLESDHQLSDLAPARTLRHVRSNNCTPTSSSSCFIWHISGGCEMCNRSAALAKSNSSATAMKMGRAKLHISIRHGVTFPKESLRTFACRQR